MHLKAILIIYNNAVSGTWKCFKLLRLHLNCFQYILLFFYNSLFCRKIYKNYFIFLNKSVIKFLAKNKENNKQLVLYVVVFVYVIFYFHTPNRTNSSTNSIEFLLKMINYGQFFFSLVFLLLFHFLYFSHIFFILDEISFRWTHWGCVCLKLHLVNYFCRIFIFIVSVVFGL